MRYWNSIRWDYRLLSSADCDRNVKAGENKPLLFQLCNNKRCRRSTRYVGFVIAIVFIIYNLATSELYLNRMDEKIQKNQPERARCCLNANSNRDMCGNTNCIWPCPMTEPKTYDINKHGDKGFFHETSGRSSLDFRQACSVESFANLNPNVTVYVLMTGKIDTEALTLNTLTSNYENIKVIPVALGDYVAGTPIEKWYYCENWNRGWFAIAHLSDALRFVTLSKYGGYYSDLDMIQLRPVTKLKNFVVEEGTGKLGSSIIHVERDHPFITKAVNDFAIDYKWYVWAHNGPDLITRTLESLCGQSEITWMTPKRCRGFSVLPAKTFYPVHWFKWREYFQARKNDENIDWGDEVIGAHVWNSKSSDFKVNKFSNQYYAQMARKSCPKVFDVAPSEF